MYELSGELYMAFAVLKAPVDFIRGPDDEPLDHRLAMLEAEYTPDGGGTPGAGLRNIELHRPPVVLLHGIWKGRWDWNWPVEWDPRFTVHVHDYETGETETYYIE